MKIKYRSLKLTFAFAFPFAVGIAFPYFLYLQRPSEDKPLEPAPNRISLLTRDWKQSHQESKKQFALSTQNYKSVESLLNSAGMFEVLVNKDQISEWALSHSDKLSDMLADVEETPSFAQQEAFKLLYFASPDRALKLMDRLWRLDRSKPLREYIKIFAKDNGREALGFLEELDIPTDHDLYEACLVGWAESAPGTIVEMIRARPDLKQHWNSIASSWFASSPDSFVKWIATQPDSPKISWSGDNVEDLMRSAREISTDPTEGFAWLINNSDGFPSAAIMGNIVATLARLSPDEMIIFRHRIENQSVLTQFEEELVTTFARLSPEKGLQLIKTFAGNNDSKTVGLSEDFAHDFIAADPQGAYAWALQEINSSNQIHEWVAQHVLDKHFRDLAFNQPSELISQLQQEMMKENPGEWSKMGLLALAQTKPESAADFLEVIDSSTARTVAREIIGSAQLSLNQAIERWKEYADEYGVEESISDVFTRWIADDIYAASESIPNLPDSPQKDQVIHDLVEAIASKDSDSAVAWVSQITDPNQRAILLTKLVKQWNLSYESIVQLEYFDSEEVATVYEQLHHTR